nr:monocyte to macrophage differentiation factor isoform X5 [Bubalus bubalis]
MRFQSRFQRFMNHRAPANGRYKPTCYEHAANCYTHAFLIVPAIVGSALLHRLSDDCWEKITAWIYGMGLCALFIVSTVFHIVAWKKSHLRYKVIELFFYLTMGFSPALVVTSMVKEQSEKSPSSLFDPAEHHGAYVNFEDGAGPRPRPGSSRLALCPLWPSPSPRHRQPTHRGPPVPSLLDFCRALLQGSQGCRAQASRTPTLLSLPRPGHKLLTTRMDFTNLPAGA